MHQSLVFYTPKYVAGVARIREITYLCLMLTIYKASAGSGKTYTLAYEYIKLLLGVRLDDGRYVLNHRRYLGGAVPVQRAHAHILAITFTNKATAEMKDRIVEKLEALTRMPVSGARDADYAADLVASYGCTREELCDVAQRSLRALLNDYGRFNISTIDAFFQTILRSFAREIDRQGDFRLELDERTVVSQALSLLFDEVNLDPSGPTARPIARWLDNMADTRMRDGKDFNPFNRGSSMYRDLVARLLQAFSEDFVARRSEMDLYLADSSRLHRLVQWLKSRIDDLDAADYAAAMAISAILSRTDPIANLVKYIDSIAAARGIRDDALRKLDKPAGYQQSLLDGSTDGLFRKNGRQPSDADAAAMMRAFASIVDNAYRRVLYKALLDNTDSLYAFNYIFRYIDRYRRDNNLIVLADTGSLLGAIISESDTPFIYERVGVELHNFLIDEFQDTSRMQWHNLRPLLANSLSADNDNLIIGDVKQSIYRFRGGDPSLLGSQVEHRDFPGLATVRGSRPGENTNYRSSHELVRFNNTLFRRIAAACAIDGYDGVAQSLAAGMADVPGYVCLRDFTADRLGANVARFFTPDEAEAMLAGDSPASPRRICYTLMATDIRRQIADGYRLDEIAILCRSNSEAADVAEFLMAGYPDIRIVSDEALKICNSRAVKLIVSVLEIIDKSYGGRERPDLIPDTPVAGGFVTPPVFDEARARRYANRRRRAMLADSFEYYMAHGSDAGEALRLALDSSARAAARITGSAPSVAAASPDGTDAPVIFDDLDRIRRIAPSNLSALVEAIIDLKIPHDERARQLPYIAAFVDLVEAYTRDFVPSVHSFLAYWHERKNEFAISSGESRNAVTIITVHKAKGLEWPCVHIPAMSWPLEARVSPMWFDLAPLSDIPADIRPPMMRLNPDSSFGRPSCPLAPQYLAAGAESVADNLNVAYVAFTRAVRELHISFISDTNPRTRALLHVSDAVEAAVTVPAPTPDGADIYTDLATGLGPDGNYTLGAPTRPVRKASPAPDADTSAVPPPVFDVSFNALNKQLTRLVDLTVASDVADDPDIGNNAPREIVDPPVGTVMEEAARRGLILHSILQRMYTIDDLDRAIDYHRSHIPAAELDIYRDDIRQAFALGGEHPQRWFSPDNIRVLAEQTIYHRPSDICRRADRIVWTAPDVIEVIDYKFTTAPRPSHYTQVRDYAAMLSTMHLGTVRAYLWYPLLGRVIPVE